MMTKNKDKSYPSFLKIDDLEKKIKIARKSSVNLDIREEYLLQQLEQTLSILKCLKKDKNNQQQDLSFQLDYQTVENFLNTISEAFNIVIPFSCDEILSYLNKLQAIYNLMME